jgi:hypothetical protein
MNDDADDRAQESRTPERRRNGGLSDEQIDAIKERILASVYEDIGRSLVKKIIWIAGAVLAALLAWAAAKGYIKP